MPKSKTEQRWVIFAGPERRQGPSPCIAQDGKTITSDRPQIASFYAFGESEEFAKKHEITLDDAMRYIGPVDWPTTP